MNLNPLKKDDNTDALVKALEDANNLDGGVPAQVAAVPPPPSPDGMPAPVATPMPTPVAPVAASSDNTSDAIANDPQLTDSTGSMPQNDSTPSGIADDKPASDATPPATTPAVNLSAPDAPSNDDHAMPEGMSADADAHLPASTGDSGELDDVKKNALEQLRPLIEKLDLQPADKFDKYLMMLRASDDPGLIKPAFEAAKDIPGEKEKAQALLDVINEINYITSSKQQ